MDTQKKIGLIFVATHNEFMLNDIERGAIYKIHFCCSS